MNAKQKTFREKLLELIAPRTCRERREFRIAMAKNRRSAARLQRAAKTLAEDSR